jgi:hypothetical protein
MATDRVSSSKEGNNAVLITTGRYSHNPTGKCNVRSHSSNAVSLHRNHVLHRAEKDHPVSMAVATVVSNTAMVVVAGVAMMAAADPAATVAGTAEEDNNNHLYIYPAAKTICFCGLFIFEIISR